MKKIFLLLTAISAFVLVLFFIKKSHKQTTNSAYTIGILQTASHPALDAALEGFTQEINALLNNKVKIVTQNAQGSIADAYTIAQQFHANPDYDAFFAIATPAAQSIASVEKVRPILLAAVTDPHALGIIDTKTNISGTKDMIDVPGQIAMLTQLLPDAKTVGLLYNSGEINSTTLVQKMQQELQKNGLTPVDFAVTSEADIPAMIDLASRKSDVILAPTDNSVASTISLIASVANKNRTPLIVSDNMLVKYGALAARGVDYKESGKQAARIAHEILVHEKKPYELPIKAAKTDRVFVNQSTLSLLELSIPTTMEQQITFVENA